MTNTIDLLRQSPLPVQDKSGIETSKSADTARDFEAVFLTQFVDQMMKTTGDTAFGGEQQADMWRSFMSEAVAKHLVEQGGLGLTGHVEQMINAYSQSPTKGQEQ